jgi:diguanylate cyclase (GGDEF)-like protein/PAS domain S-box-containing protein
LTAQNEAQLGHFIMQAPGAVAMFDRNMRYLAASRRWRSVFRVEGSRIGRSFYGVFPEIAANWKDCHRRAQAGETITEDCAPFVRADGSPQWLRCEFQPWRRPGGGIGGIVIYAEDITERVIDRERLRQSEATLRAIGDNLPDSVVYQYTRDREGNARFLYISAGVEKLTGVTVEEALADANALYAQVLPEYFPKLIAAEQAAKRDLTDFNVEAPIRRKDGEVRWMRLRSRPERRSNGETVWNGVWTDITESVIAQERLRQSEARSRAVSDNLPDSAIFQWTRDQDGTPRFLYLSAGIERIAGIAVDEAMADSGTLLSQILPKYDPMVAAAEQAAARDLTDFAVKAPIRRKDGEVRWIRLRSRPETQPDGRIVWNGVATDITEGVAHRERLRQSEAMLRAMGDNLPDSFVYRYRRDPAGNPQYLYISAGVQRLTGVRAEEILADAGALYAQVLPEYLPKLLAAEQAARRGLADFAADAPIRRKDGEVRWMRLRSRPERQSNGDIVWNGVQTDITESVADREKLRQSEAMLRAIGDSLPESALYRWTRDRNGVARYLYVSAGIEKLTGLSVEQFLAGNGVVLSLVLPEYRQALVAADQKSKREVSDFDVKMPIRHTDGDVRWVRMHSRPEPQPDGLIIWNGVWTDITQAVAHQEKLRQSEAMLRAISDNLPDSAVFRWTRDQKGVARYLYISAGIEKLTGLTVEQVLADDGAVRSQVLPEYLPTLAEAEHIAQRSVSDVAVEVPIRRVDGEVRWMRLRSRPETQPDGQITRNGVWTDITESVAHQEKLRQSEAKLRAMGDNLPDSVVYQCARDPEGKFRFLYISAGVEKLTGVTVQEALADVKALYALVLPEYLPKLFEAEQATRRDLTDFAVELPIRRKDGEVRWTRLRSRPERRSDGVIIGNGVCTDITESVADHERLRQSEAMVRAIGDNLPDSVVYRFTRDTAGNPKFLYVSAGVERLAGVTVEEVMADAQALYARALPEYLPMLLAAEEAATRDLTDLTVEVPIRRKDGELRWMRLRSSSERQADGAVVRNGVGTDITAERQLEAKLLEAGQRDSFRLELSDAIKPLCDPFDIIAIVSERLGKQLGCHQVLFAEIDVKEEHAVIRREWTDGSMPTSVGVHKIAEYGLPLLDELRAGKVSAVDDVTSDPRVGSDVAIARHLARGIGAFLRAPIVKNGKLVTVLSIFHQQPRHWSAMDMSLAEDVAERTWEAIERVRAMEALRGSEERLRYALRAANAGAWEWDQATNSNVWSEEAWRLYGLEPHCCEPTLASLLDTIHPDDRAAVLSSAREAVAAGREIEVEWRTNESGDAQRWLMSRGGPMHYGDRLTARYTGVVIDITDRKKSEEKIGYLALHDTLTGLPNRAAFNERLAAAIAKADNSGTSVAVLCLDLDRFKEVNDVFGHAVGDELLRRVSQRFRAVAEGAQIARVGGDEFTCMVCGTSLPARASDLAGRLHDAGATIFDIDGRDIRISISIGVAIYPDHGDVEAVLANADAALYRAKAEGGGICFFDSSLDTRLRDRRALVKDLENAVDRNELLLHYQPQAGADDDIFGFEALLRWRHPRRGLVAPMEFVPVAEESGLIAPIGEWVLREACREAASWPLPKTVAVNLSPKQFLKEGLPKFVHTVLLETGLAPRRLELEITESVLIDDFSRVSTILRQLKALGVRVAMDDFGTGYSSLSYLHSFPFDKIKIDASFVSSLNANKSSEPVIRAIIGLGHGLGVPVIAEGVETEEQLGFLRSAGCVEAQGYLIGRPNPIDVYAAVVGRSTAGGRVVPSVDAICA